MAKVPEPASTYRQQVQRVLDSGAFQGSVASRKLLLYLMNRTLAGSAAELKEYTIGVEALGRPPDYDPQIDPSVRVQVSRLRKRLATYYEAEAGPAEIQVELPRRQFALRFSESEPADAPKAPGPAAGMNVVFWRRLSLALVFALTALIIVFTVSRKAPASALGVEGASDPFTSEVREFWRPYLEGDLPAKLSLGVAMFVRVPSEDPTTTTYLRQSHLNDWPPVNAVPGLEALRGAIGGADAPHPFYNYCGVGEAIAAYVLGKHLDNVGLDVPIVRSSFLSWHDVQSSNLIFVGPPKFNRQLEAGAFEKNFRVVEGGVENSSPQAGELSFYGKEMKDGRPTVAHAVISRFQNGSGSGTVTVFASNDGTGTWASVEQITRPALLASLLPKLKRPDGTLPESFEVLLRARCDLDYPVEIQYVTHRSY